MSMPTQEEILIAVCLGIEEYIITTLSTNFPFHYVMKERYLHQKIERSVRLAIIKYSLYATNYNFVKTAKRSGFSRSTVKEYLKNNGMYDEVIARKMVTNRSGLCRKR